MNNAQLQLFNTNKQLTNRQTKLPKIFTAILTIILSLALSFTPNSSFASTLTNTSSTNASFFSNTTAVVATAAAIVGVGLAAIIGLSSNNSSNNNSPTPTPVSSAKAITAFAFTNPAATGTINESAKTIAITVPYGTTVTSLIATFTTTGASVTVNGALQTSGTTTNDFTSPVTYIITAADSSIATYTVTVTIAPQTTFTVTYSDSNGNTKTDPHGSYTAGATVTVLSNTNSNLQFTKAGDYVVADWSLSGTHYPINAGTASTFTINADTTLSAEWVKLGTTYGGGTVISIDTDGLTPPTKKILIMANTDQSPSGYMMWATKADGSVDNVETLACHGSISGDDGCGGDTDKCTYDKIGSGSANKARILAHLATEDTSSIVSVCQGIINGYSDWYPPSRWELNEAFTNGGLSGSAYYWSSTEVAGNSFVAWVQGDGGQGFGHKNATYKVRAVRAINY